jgi:hypothetical protein
MQCSPALVDIPNFFDEYQNCIRMMSPISEETLLFLLLRRFSDLTGAEVYAEIRLLEDVQIYDSTISVPQVRLSSNSVASILTPTPRRLPRQILIRIVARKMIPHKTYRQRKRKK